MKIALLTGASSGLGCAYAKYIGEIFPEIEAVWALARREGRLVELAQKVSKPQIVPVECDLIGPDPRCHKGVHRSPDPPLRPTIRCRSAQQ